MKVDKLRLFNGRSVRFNEDIEIYSPTIDEISNISEGVYSYFLVLASFDGEKIGKVVGDIYLKKIFSEKELNEALKELEDEEILFDIILQIPELVLDMINAFKFFTKKEFYAGKNGFYDVDVLPDGTIINEKLVIHKGNFRDIASIIKEVNCIKDEEDLTKKYKFKNERTKKNFERLKELKKQYNIHTALTLKDMCSILCAAEGNGLDIFNIGDATIYQVYEQFERLGVKENYKASLALWANTYTMKENGRLSEWMVKTKL